MSRKTITNTRPEARDGDCRYARVEQAANLIVKARSLNALTWFHDNLFGTPVESDARKDVASDVEGELSGWPIIVKDNIDVIGTPTSAGTPGLRGCLAQIDSPVVRLLRAAGALVVAKANLHELALGATSINHVFGPVINPHDHRHAAGGSSGGSAAAVAIGMAPLALGTDTSGSCRVPASCCGVVGFKPSLNRYPIDGVVPISLHRDVVGLIARNTASVIAADRVLVPEAQLAAPAVHARLGVVPELASVGVARHVRPVFDAAMRRLKGAGVEIVQVSFPGIADRMWPTQVAMISYDMPRHLAVYLRRRGIDLDVGGLAAQIADPEVKRRVSAMLGAGSELADRHHAALRAVRRLRSNVVGVMRRYRLDALVYPTIPTTAPLLTEAESIDLDGKAVPTGRTLLRNTLLASLADLPSISMPIGRASNGLPVGALLDGWPGGDANLLALAARLAAALADPTA